MKCREQCGACCIAASISRPIPGMPDGKPAGVVCINLDLGTRRCRIWGRGDYPETCRRFQPDPEVCGSSATEALVLIERMEIDTAVVRKPQH